MDNKIVEKIRKLLALSGSDNDHESQAALAMAQKLMMEYKISEKDISDSEPKKCVQKKTSHYFTNGAANVYVESLASIIADNFCCINYFSTHKGKRKKYICFMGLEEDVALCEEAMNVAMAAIYAGYNRVWKSMQNEWGIDYIPTSIWNPAKRGYIEGYLAGLKEVFREQRAAHQEWGLVLVVPPEAEKFADSLNKFSIHDSVRSNYVYYSDGYADGKNFNMNKKIKSGPEYFLED